MAKQLNVNLGFTADTSQAAAQLQQLQKQLQDLVLIGGQKTSPLGLTKELMQATEKAAELKIALEGATNPKTGMLDLSKFNTSLQKSNTSIQEYAQHLYSLGPAGQQAFSQLASSINQAEIPLKRSSKMLTEFATTLKNTARWQISSSILHGFMGTVQSAWRYAQNLNASLNDIRIVTGANVDKMTQFAKQANRSAKALSTTTNEYAKASLIYYQQGLDASQVQERTDITIKMANASGQSAETVSDQMTAVWNNFAKGGDDLERFADVMVRLGADTASSSDEIAQGLEKFASIGDMVGLSFNNAAAALATVTATTRQSADVVGTAFKTIFARIQGLKLGETLEDGTDLNKYSEALATVGISIKEQNGELKDMDTILAEMGAKWQTLSKDQQVALAQTVAGVRQYNQLVALMDNFDFYEQNLERAENADGSLQKQADTYAESWEAASKRVTAAAEDIYDSLLKDNVFIKLTDGVAGFLNIIGDTIDGIGGMKGALALLGVVITRVFSQDIANSLERFAYNIKSFTKKGRENLFNEQLKTKQNTNQALRDFQNDGTITGSTRADVNKYQADIQDQMALKAKSLLDSGRQLSEVEQKKMQIMSDQVRILGEQATQAASLREQSEKTTGSLERQLSIRMAQATKGQKTPEYTDFKADIENAKKLQTQFGIGNTMLQKFQSLLKGSGDKGKTLKNITQYFEEFIEKANTAGIEVGELQNILNNLKSMKINGADTFINAFETELIDLGGRAEQVFMDIQTEAHRLADAGQMNPQQLLTFIQILDQLQREFTETGTFTEQQIVALRDLGIQVTQTGEIIRGFTGRIPTMAEGIVAFGNTLSSLTMAFTSLQGLISTWNNQDATFGEKLIATFTTLGMVIPIVVTAFQQQNLAQMATMSSAIASALGLGTLSAAEIAAGLAGEAGAAGTVSFGAALWALLWPIGAVIAVIAILAGSIYLLFQAFTAENRAAKENAEAMAKQNEETKKLAEETNTLNNEIKSLIDTFNQQRAAGEDVSDTYNELVKKLNEVKQNYKKLNVSDSTIALLEQAEAIGLATENWEAYTKAQKQAQKEVKDEVGKQAEATTQANLKGAVAAFTDGQGNYEEDSSGKYVRRHVGNAGEDKEVSKILNKSEYAEIFKDINDDEATLRIDWDNESEFMEDYQLLANALRDMEIAGQTSNGTYQELKKEFDAMAEYAGEIEANMTAATEHRMQKKLDELGINAEDINNLDEYTYTLETLTDEMTNFFTSSEEARKKAKAFLGTFGNTTESAAAYNFVEKFGNKMKTAIDYKKVGDSMSVNEKGQAVVTAAHIDVQAKYNEEQIKQEVQAMFNYIQGLPEDMRKIAMSIDLEHIDSLEEFKTVFNKTKAFEAQVRIKADPQSVINSAKQIRDDLSEAMESFSEQGYLTTSQAIDFLDEFPQYSNYLKQTADGYAFTEEAIKEFNGALKDEKDALKELINPTNIGGQALYDFGKQLISLEAAVEGEGLKKFITDMQDLTTQFIEGKIKSDEYFTALNDNINNLSFDENTSINDVMAFGNEVVPSMVSGIDSYLGAIDAAFEKGQIGAIEYRQALTNSANAVLKLEQKTRDAIKSTEEFSGIKFNEQTQQYERTAKWLGTVDQKTRDVVDNLNESLKRSKELEKVLKDMASFEGINVAATEDYEDLQEIFDEDFSIEIDDSELDAAIAKTQDYRDSIAEAFATLDSEAQKAVIEKIGELGNKFDDTSGKAFNMSTQTNTALSSIGVKAGTVTNEVEQAAVQMLNGTYVATTENSQLTADAMGLILESGANTSQMVATMTSNVIDGIGRLVQNFDATIEIRSDGFGVDWQPFTFDILGKEFTIKLPAPHFDIGFKGNLNGEAASAFNDIVSNLQGINTITSGKSSGGMSSFAPPSSLGDAGDVQLDEDPDGSGGGGGGGGKPKVVQKKAKDEIERYHEISKAIEDQERVVDRLSKAKDKAYGANKLKAIDNEIAALQKLNELDSQHLKQIREKLALDRKAAAKEHGITFDEFGRINNYEEIIKQKMEWWRTEQQKIQDRETEYEKEKNYNEEYDADGAIKLKIDQDKEKIDEQYEDFKEAITQYEETYSLFEDTVDKMQDQFDQMAEKAIEKITYEVEFKVEFEESAIDLLDFQIELLGEDFDAFAEIASITMEKTTHLSKALQAQSDGVGALYEAYDKGAISLDQFVENMKESLPDILSSMQNMISLDKEMMEYYSKAFDAAEEKFTEYLDFIDSGISKLDHFQNMLSLIGKEQNYDMLGVVLESQYTSASHRLQASSDWYETTKKEYDALYNRWIAEKNLLGPKELEMLEEKLKVARTKMQEADEQRLSDLEAVGEKAQEILQNNLNMARKKFEENLVGSSLEDYMNELDRLSKKQEEYLTNTNKMYETNKLIRQAQMEMDKTDNNRAKQQYNDYVKYIEQLQETGKLSSYELSVAQAKYELLQAQIALEEAKDAKDQVRLTRDSEGNYGYVYTANEDKVSEAEQAVADAENKLYNIGLEGAQDYQSKKAEILQEAIDTFASIEEQYQTGQIETEAEFNAKMEEAKQYYYDRLKEYDNLYYMALGVMQEESYGNTIDYELDSRNVFDTFATHVDGYLGDVEQSFTDYNNKVGVVKQEVGDDLEAMRKKTEEVTKETEKLTLEAEKLTDQIDNELLSVREATSIWGAYRDELYKNIEANKALIEQLRTIQELQGGELADYSSFISDQVAKGKGYDDRLIQEALSKRWLKMEGVDNYDYTQKKIDYVQEYADLNGLTFEEAETALQDDAWYKTLGILRQYKIERTDWAAKKKEILEKDPKADVSWIDNIIAEKLSYDWAAKIQQYIERNPGLKYSDEYLQEMLTIRKIKIDSMKDEDKKDILSNDDLLAPYIEKGKLIDDRKSVSSAVSAATGGYTGEWGPEGKIAILHEKELILNAQDTQNFLSAVEILREINGMLDQNALVASLGAINMQALSLNSSADQVLQQEVTIHADFPNVTDHNEIELAIDNLINAASQHAYRT